MAQTEKVNMFNKFSSGITQRLIVFVGVLILAVGVIVSLYTVSSGRIIKALGPDADIEFSGIYFSANHVVRVEYRVLNDGEISHAQCRLLPFLEVVLAK